MTQALLDVIHNHAQPDLRRRIEVPEWALADGKPLITTYTMVTLDDYSVVQELDGHAWSKQAARFVALKACDETGKKLFALTDALALHERAAPEVVNRVALQMLGRASMESAATSEEGSEDVA